MHSLLFLSHPHQVLPELWQDDQMTKEAFVPIPGESNWTGSHESSAASNLGSHLGVSAAPRGSPLTAAGWRQRPPTPWCRCTGSDTSLPVWAGKQTAWLRHRGSSRRRREHGFRSVLKPDFVWRWTVKATTVSVQRPNLQVTIFYSMKETSRPKV